MTATFLNPDAIVDRARSGWFPGGDPSGSLWRFFGVALLVGVAWGIAFRALMRAFSDDPVLTLAGTAAVVLYSVLAWAAVAFAVASRARGWRVGYWIAVPLVSLLLLVNVIFVLNLPLTVVALMVASTAGRGHRKLRTAMLAFAAVNYVGMLAWVCFMFQPAFYGGAAEFPIVLIGTLPLIGSWLYMASTVALTKKDMPLPAAAAPQLEFATAA